MSQNVISMGEESLDSVEYSSKSMIDRIVGVDPRQKVTCGETVVAMVLNALGFVARS